MWRPLQGQGRLVGVSRGERQGRAQGAQLVVGRTALGDLGLALKRPGVQARGVPRSACAVLGDGGRDGFEPREEVVSPPWRASGGRSDAGQSGDSEAGEQLGRCGESLEPGVWHGVWGHLEAGHTGEGWGARLEREFAGGAGRCWQEGPEAGRE